MCGDASWVLYLHVHELPISVGDRDSLQGVLWSAKERERGKEGERAKESERLRFIGNRKEGVLLSC